jgi:FAD/FMN-containing dehydrogenase
MKISGWGRYPVVDAEIFEYRTDKHPFDSIDEKHPLIAYGNGRSYGDSALSDKILRMRPAKRMLQFNDVNGTLTCEAGVLLSEILDTFLPRGWFLQVTPGTKKITVGGAIASDVHGKNHHIDGAFSECVENFRLILPNGTIKTCSKTENKELFHATCGGMGLTGIILEATISLKSVESNMIRQKTIKSSSLKETFRAFEEYHDEPYSVAWLDCTASGDSLGRSLLNVGEFKDDGNFNYQSPRKLNIPVEFPGFLLNNGSINLFNKLYFNKTRKEKTEGDVSVDSFFYPLDVLQNWNRLYGKKGPLQYQFVLPKDVSFDGVREILQFIQKKNLYSTLGVLKLFGKKNENLLSFPMEGYTLTLDFKVEPKLFPILNDLDEIVSDLGGRIYLAKDARMTQKMFELGYPGVDDFRALRKKYGMDTVFNSLQSKRLNI